MMSSEISSEQVVINVKNLHKEFDKKIAVDDISITVKKGEIYGFVGPNGGGKTTTIRMICGLLTPDSGSGTCLGFDIVKQSKEIKKQIGYMTQKFSLYDDLSVYENLEFLARMYDLNNINSAVEEGVKFLGLDKQYKNKLVGNLSGGWKQRLALAAAILHKPKLLLLDEPTIGVDPKARRQFWDEIHRLSSIGVTTLVSTHYMDEAQQCNHLAYISQGNILAQGTVEQIIAHSKLLSWSVEGPNFDALTDKLRQYNAIEQVTNYGNRLHVSGTDNQKVIEVLREHVQKPLQWKKIKTDLEDVFIYYSRFSEQGLEDG